jgi:hypothetical protein
MNGKLSAEEADRLRSEIEAMSGVEHEQEKQWIRTAVRYAEMTASGYGDPSEAPGALFWIRLFEVLGTLRDQWTRQAAMLDEVVGNDDDERRRARLTRLYVEPQRRVLEAMEALRSEFSEDELLYVERRRHVEAHPYQRGYRLLGRRGGFSPDFKSVLTGSTYSVEGVGARTLAVNKARGGEAAAARSFATRSADRLRTVLDTIQAWDDETLEMMQAANRSETP